MNDSFGWSYYGFYVGVVIWLAAYFTWAVWAGRRERGRK